MKIRITRKKTTLIQFVKCILKDTNYFLLVTGIFIIAFASRIEPVLHWIVGSATIVIGVAFFIKGLRDFGNKNSTTYLTVSSVLIVLGIVILSQRENSVGTIMIIWGFIGIARGSFVIFEFVKHHDDIVVYDIVELIMTIVDSALALTLLIEPYQQVVLHIRILGAAILMMSFKTIKIPGADRDKCEDAKMDIDNSGNEYNEFLEENENGIL